MLSVDLDQEDEKLGRESDLAKSVLRSSTVLMKSSTIVETKVKDERELREAIVLDSGATYTGEWKNGKRDGTGVQVWLDDSTYTGEWCDGKANG